MNLSVNDITRNRCSHEVMRVVYLIELTLVHYVDPRGSLFLQGKWRKHICCSEKSKNSSHVSYYPLNWNLKGNSISIESYLNVPYELTRIADMKRNLTVLSLHCHLNIFADIFIFRFELND